MLKRVFSKSREYLTLFSIAVFSFTLISLVLFLIVLNSVEFADYFNYNITAPFRAVLSWFSSFFPFSIVEICLFASPFILTLLIYIGVRKAKKGRKSVIRYASVLVSFICIVFITFVWTYSSGYHMSKIEDKMGLDRSAVSKDELYLVSEQLVNELNELCNEIKYDETGASVMPYSYDEMSEKICEAYEKFVEKNGVLRTFSSRVKPLMISEPMTYTHISGIYSFMSGESNLNVNYPDFIVASTAAHEMAHQRGIAREDECNFIGFAVLLESDDPFLRYSAYLDIYPNILNALRGEDAKLSAQLASKLDKRVVNDRVSYSKFFQKYADSVASQVAGSINNSYLQANGQENGTKSYGMVVEIVCAYLLNKTK